MSEVAIYNLDVTPNIQTVINGAYEDVLLFDADIDNPNRPRFCFHRLGGNLYGFSYGDLSLYRISLAGRAGEMSGAPFRLVEVQMVNSSEEFQGKLWLGSAASGNVYYWDEKLLVTDETGLGSGPLILAAHREEILAFGTNFCQRRDKSGAWSAVSMPGGLTSFVPRCRLVYKDVLYVGGYDNGASWPGKILSYDGSSLAVARTVVAGNASNSFPGVTDLHMFNGSMYYAYQKKGAGRVCKLGIFDGSWDDDHKDLLAQISPSADLVVGRLADYRGNLMVGFGIDGSGALYRSPGTATDGTYVAVSSSPLSSGIYDMIASI